MPYARQGDVRIHWESAGSGPPVVLVHGYTSNLRTHWRASGWIDALAEHHQVVALDVRGHGRSDAPRDPNAYTRQLLAGDIAAVAEAAGLTSPAVLGYSMGAIIASETLVRFPGLFSAGVLGGMGAAWPENGDVGCTGDAATERPVRDLQRSVRGLAWWLRYYNPLAMRALRAGMFHGQPPMPAERLPGIRVPVLVVAGTRDPFCAGAELAAELIPGAERLLLPGQTHHSAVSDPRFREAVCAFFQRHLARS